MLRLILFAGLAVLGFYFVRWLSHQPRGVQWQSILGLAAAVLLLLVVTGRAHWLAVGFAAVLAILRLLLPLLGQLPLLKRVFGGAKTAQSSSTSGQNQTSNVKSRYILMTLNHDSGEITGEVLAGQYSGKMLDQLTLEELLTLLQDCQDDEESVALLQAFLDREYGSTWQEQSGETGEQQAGGGPGDRSGRMSRDEALEILGLSTGASEQEIIEAHRRLMQVLHPDRGGSTYFAAKTNQAKETLLGK